MRTVLVFALLLALTACATIVDSGPWAVPINSNPPGATVSNGGNELGVTPCTVWLRADPVLELRLDGYDVQSVSVPERFNPWVIGNVVFGGLIGILIDAVSGAMFYVDDSPITVTLRPSQQPTR